MNVRKALEYALIFEYHDGLPCLGKYDRKLQRYMFPDNDGYTPEELSRSWTYFLFTKEEIATIREVNK